MDLIVVVLSMVPSSAFFSWKQRCCFCQITIYFSWASHYITMQVLVNCVLFFIVKNWTGIHKKWQRVTPWEVTDYITKRKKKKKTSIILGLYCRKKCSEHENKCWLIMAQFWCWGIWCRSKTSINVQIVCYVLFYIV